MSNIDRDAQLQYNTDSLVCQSIAMKWTGLESMFAINLPFLINLLPVNLEIKGHITRTLVFRHATQDVLYLSSI